MKASILRALSLFLCLLLTVLSLPAQQTPSQADPPWMTRMIEALKLNDGQITEVRQVYAKHRAEVEKLVSDRAAAADKAAIDQKLVAERNLIIREIVPVLTPEQRNGLMRLGLNNPQQPPPQGNRRPNIPMPTGPALSTLDQPVKLSATKIPTTDQKILQLLDRMTFGPRPGDIAMVKEMGIDNFINSQLHPETIDDKALAEKLAGFETLQMSSQELIAYAPPPQVLARAQQIRAEQEGQLMTTSDPNQPDEKTRQQLQQQTNRENTELPRAKMIRAIYSERQLEEVMTDFWFNHFNVFIGKDNERYLILPYERDVIRPNAMGKFKDLLLAVAQSPAMVLYLDNWQSMSPDSKPPRQPFNTDLGRIYNPLAQPQRKPVNQTSAPKKDVAVPTTAVKVEQAATNDSAGQQTKAQQEQKQVSNDQQTATVKPVNQTQAQTQPKPPVQRPRPRYGINENYARELMELHTLGVDGGYTQQDVIEVARCFTGWTMQQPPLGSSFMFRAWAHDNGEKTVLGHKIPAGGGFGDGLQVIDILVHQPATAHFIAYKLCQRFVADKPSETIVNKVANTFTKTDGDIRECLRTIFTSPEFYSADAFRSKMKSPFEFVVSTIRATGAYTDAQALIGLMNQLGEGLYQQQFPTGYPEDSSKWTNTGALLARMNQALRIST